VEEFRVDATTETFNHTTTTKTIVTKINTKKVASNPVVTGVDTLEETEVSLVEVDSEVVVNAEPNSGLTIIEWAVIDFELNQLNIRNKGIFYRNYLLFH